MSISAMKQALEALEDIWGCLPTKKAWPQDQVDEAIQTLRQAIAEAEKQEPVAWIVDGEIKVRLDMAGKLYYSETNVYAAPVHASDIPQECVDETAKDRHEFECPRCGHCCQQREWVGLTDEERHELNNFRGLMPFIHAIEAKLKEKNT
jgi:hypothetical protein